MYSLSKDLLNAYFSCVSIPELQKLTPLLKFVIEQTLPRHRTSINSPSHCQCPGIRNLESDRHLSVLDLQPITRTHRERAQRVIAHDTTAAVVVVTMSTPGGANISIDQLKARYIGTGM